MELNFDEIIDIISKEANIDKQTILDNIKEKKEKLGGLVSDLGAAHLVARDYNVKLVKPIVSGDYKIKDLKDGLRGITINVKVIQKNEPKEFQSSKGKGKIGSLFVMDETGSARVVFWNDLVDMHYNKFKEDDTIKITNAFVKIRDNRIEIHLTGDSEVSLSESELNIKGFERKCIIQLKDNELVEIAGTIIEVNEPFIYNSCPVCKRKLIEQEDGFYCPVHNKVEPKLSIFLHFNLDDSTDMIRVNTSGNKALNILNVNLDKLKEIKDNPELFEEFRNNLLGKYVVIKGKVINNERLNKLEINLSSINLNPNLDEEAKKTRECIEKLNDSNKDKEKENNINKNIDNKDPSKEHLKENTDNSDVEIDSIEEIDIDDIIDD